MFRAREIGGPSPKRQNLTPRSCGLGMTMVQHSPAGNSMIRWMWVDIYPWVADRELDPLRLKEQRAKPKAKAQSFAAGAQVKHPESGLEGLVGTVQGTKGRFALVLFPGFNVPVHIEPKQLIAC